MDGFADGEAGGGGGGGGVADVEDAAAVDEVEVVEQAPVGEAGLGADAGWGGDEVVFLDGGDEALEGSGEFGFAEGAAYFVVAHAPVAPGEFPEAWPGEGVGEVAWVDVAPAVAFAGEGEDGVGPGFDAAVVHAGEVDAEEGKFGVGHGVDEVADEVALGGGELEVFAAEGEDAQVEFGLGLAGEAVGVESGAGAELGGEQFALVGEEAVAVGGFEEGFDAGAESYFAAGGLDAAGEGVGEAGVVGDAGFGDVQGAEAGGVGLVVRDGVALDPA